MRVDFKNMPDNSRIWIYQSDRDLIESEISIIDDKTTLFLDSWQAHGKDLECSYSCLLYTSPSPRDGLLSRMPSSA